eukprot:CAMPEP_0198149040 /NCGR_PEP_ID=MMETSP1443-20131203/44759_1 /TAXON_ID=186043 /ORGANISM="Entomoneis sp., Strain CCMP2396" /LENGTH=38 /DNA_ID= /DNA_START= /DNA_END= /DNA_ORIENTATION=
MRRIVAPTTINENEPLQNASAIGTKGSREYVGSWATQT